MLRYMDIAAIYTRKKTAKTLNRIDSMGLPVVMWAALVTAGIFFGWLMVYYHWRKFQGIERVKQDWQDVNTEREYPPPMWKYLVTKDKEVINWIQEGF